MLSGIYNEVGLINYESEYEDHNFHLEKNKA